MMHRLMARFAATTGSARCAARTRTCWPRRGDTHGWRGYAVYLLGYSLPGSSEKSQSHARRILDYEDCDNGFVPRVAASQNRVSVVMKPAVRSPVGAHSHTMTSQWCVMGQGAHGELGLGEAVTTTSSLARASVIDNDNPVAVASVALGQEHTILVAESGKVYVCGRGTEGQLGLGGRLGPQGSYHGGDQHAAVWTPRCMPLPTTNPEDRVVKACAGRYLTLLLTSTGKLFVCGSGFNGELGRGGDTCLTNATPLEMPTAKDGRHETVTDIAVGRKFCVAVTRSNRVFFWGALGHTGTPSVLGRSASPRAGAGSQHGLTASTPWELTFPPDASPHDNAPLHVACGDAHVALSDADRVWTFGVNTHGSLATGDSHSHFKLTPVVHLPWRSASGSAVPARVVCGPYATLAIAGGRIFVSGVLPSLDMLGTPTPALAAEVASVPEPLLQGTNAPTGVCVSRFTAVRHFADVNICDAAMTRQSLLVLVKK